jgi:hypothetical protein
MMILNTMGEEVQVLVVEHLDTWFQGQDNLLILPLDNNLRATKDHIRHLVAKVLGWVDIAEEMWNI